MPLAGIDPHFIHEPDQGSAPPLLLSHGWPGSVFEFRRPLPLLTDPARLGGDPADAFAKLMTDVLGYPRFAARGGDWGSFITTRLGHSHAKS